jgi:hypothetical protein
MCEPSGIPTYHLTQGGLCSRPCSGGAIRASRFLVLKEHIPLPELGTPPVHRHAVLSSRGRDGFGDRLH